MGTTRKQIKRSALEILAKSRRFKADGAKLAIKQQIEKAREAKELFLDIKLQRKLFSIKNKGLKIM